MFSTHLSNYIIFGKEIGGLRYLHFSNFSKSMNQIFSQQPQWTNNIIASTKDGVFKTHRENCMAKLKDSSEGKLKTFQKFKTEYSGM